MLKFTAVVSLMLIGSTLWAASLSCDSCGSECASACGTRHFRSCCFNYLRKKRGPEVKFVSQNDVYKTEVHKQKLPSYILDDTPADWNAMSSDFKLYPYDDTLEKRLQILYDL